MRLRRSSPNDAGTITAWLSDERVHRWWGGAPVPLEEVIEKYTGRREPAVVVYLIEAGGCAVGLIQAWQDDVERGLDMFVAADEQGCGRGPAAAQALAEDLSRRGWHDLTVDPAVGNAAAIRAWARAGFVATGRRGLDDGHETLLMTFRPQTDSGP
nr:GNAT family N-acetyltransferase [Kineococcus siccus]